MKWYIAGSIDHNPDFGASSRAVIRNLLEDIDIAYFCPALSEQNQRNFEQKETLGDMLIKEGDWQENLVEISEIVDADIEGLTPCQGIIVILDKYVGSGTASECTLMNFLDRPVIGIFTDGTDPRKVAPWTLSRVTRFVGDLVELSEVVREYERA